jgi:NADH oxidase (H2O2-forming)
VIIGCGAGGGTAAQFARKTDRKTSITIFEKNSYPQYSKCGLPYAISGVIPKIDDLIEFSEDWFKKQNIDLLLNTTVEKIDPNKKMIYAKKDNKTVEKSYGSLIICTGAKPSMPPIQNIDAKGVFSLRTIDDAKNIMSYAQKGMNATIIGAGLIGLEMADNLYKKGLKITVVEVLSIILPNTLDEDMAKMVKEQIPDGIDVFTGHLASKIERKDGKITQVYIKNKETSDEKKIDTDLLIVATGVKPEVSLAESAGCKIGSTGGILTNQCCETSVKDIYAVGDCTEFVDFVTKDPILVGLGSIAVRQGICAGVNAAAGSYTLPKGFLQTSTSKLFNVEIASVGPTSSTPEHFSIISGKYNGHSLPEYYPGGKPITLKVLVDEYTGVIMGAQAVGDKAAQRINTFACAILGRMDIETMRKLETAYAPPVAPTLDAETLVCDIIAMKLARKK